MTIYNYYSRKKVWPIIDKQMDDKYCTKKHNDIYIMHVPQKNVSTRPSGQPCRQS